MKKTLAVLAFIIALTSLIYVVDNFGKTKKPTEPKIIKKVSVSQKVAGTDTKPVSYGVNFGDTALDLLEQTSSVETKGEGEQAYVTKINGKAADPAKKEFWALYVNGKQSEVGAGSYQIKPGDKIEWRVEKFK